MLCLVFIARRIKISLLLLSSVLLFFYDSTFDFVVYGKMLFKLQFHVVLMCARSYRHILQNAVKGRWEKEQNLP